MRIHFLGTGAAEGWPGIFCRCVHCNKARSLGGKNIRTRSSVIIDETLKVDFPPDSYYHVLRYNIDLASVEHLLFTHSHYDHLQQTDIEKRKPGTANCIDHPLQIYGHDLVLHFIKQVVRPNPARLSLNLIQPFQQYNLNNETRITPLLANHDKDETCLLYFIEKNGKALLYGHDTGWFPEETWNWLEDKAFDLAILDCTNGPLEGFQNHLNIDSVIKIKNIFKEKNMIRKTGRIIATHFSHNCGMLHEDLEKRLSPHGIIVAFDGMKYEI